MNFQSIVVTFTCWTGQNVAIKEAVFSCEDFPNDTKDEMKSVIISNGGLE